MARDPCQIGHVGEPGRCRVDMEPQREVFFGLVMAVAAVAASGDQDCLEWHFECLKLVSGELRSVSALRGREDENEQARERRRYPSTPGKYL